MSRRARSLPALVALAAVAACGGGGSSSHRAVVSYTPPTPWSQASGSAARTDPGTAVGPRSGHVLWSRHLEGAVVPGAAIGVDGSVLQASNGGVLHALDPSTGRDRWTADGGSAYGSDLSTTPAVLADGTILWPGPGDDLIALSATGRVLWREHFAGQVLSPAVVGGGRVYVADMSGGLTAFDIGIGTDVGSPGAHSRAWSLSLGGTSYSSPSVGPDGTVYVASDRTVVAVEDRGSSAHVRWRYRARDSVEVSTAVATDGTVVVGTNGDDELGLHPDGSVAWRFPKNDYSYSSPVVRGGRAYFGDHGGYLDVVDAASGGLQRRDLGIPKAQGTTSVGTGVWTAPVVDASGDVYFGTAAGHVYGFDATGRRLWDLDAHSVVDSYPALTADGTLVVGASDGTVYAIKG